MADATSVTPLEGTTSVDDKMTFEPERLSYAAARAVAERIARDARQCFSGARVIIAGDAFLADLGNLAAARLQLDALASDYDFVNPPLSAKAEPTGEAKAEPMGEKPEATFITAGLQSALGIVALLRENVEFHGVATRVDAVAFDLALAAALNARGSCTPEKVFVPALTAIDDAVTGETSLRGRWESVQRKRHEAWRAAGPTLAKLARLDGELELATRNGDKTRADALATAVFEERRKADPIAETLGQADRRLADLQSQWDKVSEVTGLTLLARLLRTEAVLAQAGDHATYLHAAVVASGGHHRVSRSLWRMLFFGDGLSAMGGVVVRWAVMERDGHIANGGIVAERRFARFPMVVGDGWT